jgi:type I restriction-modification system DNA methylase subunit/restriction endonuclease S subunit
MPTYTCEKCARVFKQKSGFDDHKAKKIDCSQNTLLNAVIETKVEEKVKEVIRATQQKPEITQEALPAFFEDLHNLLWNKAGLNPERALEHMTFFFAYRLIEQQADMLSLPQECRWTFIASLKNENDLFETIKKGVSEFRKRSKTKAFFKPHEIQKADIVYEIVQQINRISLKILQETDTLGDIFEYMLGRGMSTMSDEGQYFTNRAICKLAFKLAYEIKKNLYRADGTLCTFADWFCGTGGFPAEFIKGVKANFPSVDWKKDSGSIYCQDMNLSSVTTTLLNMLILTGIPFNGEKIRGSNSFTDPITTGAGAPFSGLTIDYCFMNPPYGGDKSKGKDYKFAYCKKIKGDDGSTSKKFYVNQEIQSIGIEDDDKVSAGVQLAMATLSADGGVCSIVLPQGFFFGASKKCIELRKKIAEEYKIWYVVDIASGSFLNTGTKTSMMVFQKGVGPTDKVAFIGLDEKPLIEASLAELRKKHYSLNYKQYLPQSAVEVEGFEMVKIKDILDFQKKPGNLGRADGKDAGKYPFYTCAQKKMYVDTCEFTRTCLIVNRGGLMNVRVDKNFSVSHDDIHVLSWIDGKTNEITVLYVAYYLGANMKLLENGMNGTTLKHLNKSFLEDFEIPLPSLERQQQIVEAIDGWASLAQQEEVALKILEKQMMFQVKEMGRGQARVKLGEVCEWQMGKRIVKDQVETGNIPVYGGGGITFYTNTSNRHGINCKISREGMSEANCVLMITGEYHQNSQGMTVGSKDTAKTIDPYLWYWLVINKESVYECGQGTAQKAISMIMLNDLEIPLPPLTEQQTLQSDFDEIRHKHAKIATYKAKAHEAIQRLIPGAKTDLGDAVKAVPENSPAAPLEPTKTKRIIKLKKGSIV